MHTLNRILTTLVLCAVLLPPATFALISLDTKEAAREQLQDAIGSAVIRYQQRTGVQWQKGKGEQTALEQQLKMESLEEQKQTLREEIVKQQRIIAAVGEKYGVTLESKEQIALLISTEKRHLERMVRDQYLRGTKLSSADPKDVLVVQAMNGASDQARDETLARTQMRFLRDLVAAEQAFWRTESLMTQREEVLSEYHDSEVRYEQAVKLVERSAAQLEEIQAIMEEVHEQVLKLQGELARIDARLREKAERTLIEKGLLDPKIGGSGAVLPRPQFSWPVYGRISAGFKEPSYQQYFGVPHYGADIVVGQETPVAAAADGVVFLVRDGGATGYSYILIGHRGGYATLYGHVSKALVTNGQEVNVGDVIALSGGQPGTHGAGPMTTAPHLHFEVIQNGVNIDPKSVLP